ncbi:hypothetical protein D3C84_959280 [compost metagenome]
MGERNSNYVFYTSNKIAVGQQFEVTDVNYEEEQVTVKAKRLDIDHEAMAAGYQAMWSINLEEANAGFVSEVEADKTIEQLLTK